MGEYTKEQVRALAQTFGLGVANKAASQEICFLPGEDYRGFLEAKIPTKIKPGEVIDTKGEVLGEHRGVAFYTIGQRQGLGIAKGYPLYITRIDYKNNRIVVGRKNEAYKTLFLVKEPHFIAHLPKKNIVLRVKIRYNHQEAPAEISPVSKMLEVRFTEPQFAITPGQSAVFYSRGTVVGGGIIDEVLE